MATKYQGAGEERLALDVFIKYMRAHDSIIAVLREQLSASKLTVPQFGILEALFHLGPLCQHQLAAKLLKSGGNITRVLDVMEKNQLIARKPEPGDRRSIRVHLTAKGKSLITKIFPTHAKHIAELFSSLTAQELKQLNNTLRKLGHASHGLIKSH